MSVSPLPKPATTDQPANPNVSPDRYAPALFRALEIIPGLCVWAALLLPFLLAHTWPFAVTLGVIAFDVYWLQRALDTAFTLYRGWRQMQRNMAMNWSAQLDGALAQFQDGNPDVIDWREVYQAVIFTTYKEEIAILRASIKSVAEADYPKERKILVLATEERDAENARHIAATLKEEFADDFGLFIVTEHPDGIVGEVKAKGANAAWAAKEMVRVLNKKGVPLDTVVVSTADADCRFVPQYFQCLTYMYATNPDRVRCSYQPVATFLNNIWEAPMISRVLAIQTTFWQMVESMRDYRLITFSTHAMSLQTLVDMDYWCTSIVNEDSRQFFRAFFRYAGDFRAIPLFMPVYMDAVHVDHIGRTMQNLYLQQQRWAYGSEHTPYVILEAIRHKEIPFLNRLALAWRQFNGHFSWATQSFYITFVGWLPIVLNDSFRDQLLAANFPQVTKVLLTITWVGVIVSNIISFKMLPPKPKKYSKQRHATKLLSMLFQWFLIPFTAIFFGAVASIDAQTRLMLGKYIGFRVTEKKAV